MPRPDWTRTWARACLPTRPAIPWPSPNSPAPPPRRSARPARTAGAAAGARGRSREADRLLRMAEGSSADPLLLAEAAYLRARGYSAGHGDRLVALAGAARLIADDHPELALRILRGLVVSARNNGQGRLAERAAAEIANLEGTAVAAAGPGPATPHERLIAGFEAWRRGDHDAALRLSRAFAAECRERGMANWMAGVLHCQGLAETARGEWAAARPDRRRRAAGAPFRRGPPLARQGGRPAARSGPHPAGLRRVAAPGEAPVPGRGPASARRRDLRRAGRGRLGGAGPDRARGVRPGRRAREGTGCARPAHPPGVPDRGAGGAGAVQPRDRGQPLPVAPDGRLPPLQGVPQAGRLLEGRAGRAHRRPSEVRAASRTARLVPRSTPSPHTCIQVRPPRWLNPNDAPAGTRSSRAVSRSESRSWPSGRNTASPGARGGAFLAASTAASSASRSASPASTRAGRPARSRMISRKTCSRPM